MRQPAPRFIMLLLLALTVSFAGRAHADDRVEARTHYQAGVKFYGSGDYKSAIREFSSAQQLVPADLNNYNLALCYDKLGDAEPAIQYYREYLNKVPNADKRAEIEASISRLEAAVKSMTAKKADEQKKIDDARRAEEAKKADDAREAARRAEEAKRAEDAKKNPGTGSIGMGGPAIGGGAVAGGAVVGAAAGAGPAVSGGVSVTGGVGSTGTPSTGQIVSTGDAQLDRVSAIDINAIRDQRVGGAGSGIADNRGGPATMPGGPAGGAAGAGPATGNVAMGGAPAGGAQPNGMAPTSSGPAQQAPAPTDKPAPAETPVYKKWWFWAVVAVSAYVVYEVANTSSTSTNARGRELPPMGPTNAAQAGGVPLFRF